jgi:hypothetical protein
MRAAAMTFFTWFLGGERYRINLALVGGIVIAMTPGENPLLVSFVAVPLLAFMGFRFRKWRMSQVPVITHRDD